MTSDTLIIDGQWGSTGKGLISGFLALNNMPDTVVCNFGPNAGHTFVFDDGKKMVVKQIPNGAISPMCETVMIGPGSIVDPEILLQEWTVYKEAGMIPAKARLYIHERACVVSPRHKEIEAQYLNKISSTCKGTGAAQASKVMREYGAVAIDCPELKAFCVNHSTFVEIMMGSECLQVESAQGFELGINSGSHYPYCTSRDINLWQIMSDCSIPALSCPDFDVIMTLRTFPIRVGNAFNEKGEMVGWSGPVYSDQEEISWEDLGEVPERTTVTNKIRRVFTFSFIGLEKAIRAIDPDFVFLNFVNYLDKGKEAPGLETMKLVDKINATITNMGGHGRVKWLGTGPKAQDIIEI